ncbi:MAG TPA: MBL fold metallo-hydrolase [Vicinamibacterales bacterium]|nr:MBL fold metallo-hydrolase [Vicinamibacterales bacterium]
MNRRMAFAAAAGLALSMISAARAEQGSQPAGSPAPQVLTVRSLHVQGNVWMLNAGTVNVAVQIGDQGVLLVDTGPEGLAEAILTEVRRLAGDKPIRYIVNTHSHRDHTGGNVKIASAGKSIISGNFAAQAGTGAADAAKILAHEQTQVRMQAEGPDGVPAAGWPTDTFFVAKDAFYFNGEAVELLHQPDAHTSGDVIVHFRKSDVIAAGDVYINTTFPVINREHGGSYAGLLAALNRIIDITVPRDKAEGGTYVIPGHGRLADEADVVDYRDMATIVRDRVRDAIGRKMSLEQVKAARLVRDYEGRFGAAQGTWTTDAFIEAAYRSLSPARPAAGAR